MKNIASFLVVLGVVLLVASSCFFSETSDETATLRLVIEEPEDRATYDCYAINVIGPGIRTADPRFPPPPNPAVFNDDSKYCFYPGIGSKLVGLDGSNNAIIEVGVPVGSPRLVQVVGIDTTDNSCPAGTFSEIWKQKIDDKVNNFPTVNNDGIYQVGRAVVNLPPGTREKQLEISQLTGTLKQFGKGYCDPPSGGGGLNFQSFVTSIYAERSLAGYITNGTGPYNFTVTEQGAGGTSVSVTDLIQFGSTQTVFDVVASDLTTLKNGSGTITVQGFKPGNPGVQDPFVYLWMAPDPGMLATDRSVWVPHFGSPSSLKSAFNVLNYSTGTSLLSSGTPKNHRALKFKLGTSTGGNIATSFMPNTEQWDDSMFFLVFRNSLGGDNQIFCLSSDDTVPCSPSITVSSFFSVRADSGQFIIKGCLDCNLSTGFVEKSVNASNIYYALGVRFKGAKMKYTLSGFEGSTTNGEGTLSGLLNMDGTKNAFLGLGKYNNDDDTDISEVLVYRHLTGPSSFTPLIPCNYINEKYGANMNCTYLNAQ